MGGTSQADAGRGARDQNNPLIFFFHIALHPIIRHPTGFEFCSLHCEATTWHDRNGSTAPQPRLLWGLLAGCNGIKAPNREELHPRAEHILR